eukprot:6163326-Amphidinium_carterae.1
MTYQKLDAVLMVIHLPGCWDACKRNAKELALIPLLDILNTYAEEDGDCRDLWQAAQTQGKSSPQLSKRI